MDSENHYDIYRKFIIKQLGNIKDIYFLYNIEEIETLYFHIIYLGNLPI